MKRSQMYDHGVGGLASASRRQSAGNEPARKL